MADHDETLRVRLKIDSSDAEREVNRAFDKINRNAASRAQTASAGEGGRGHRERSGGGVLALAGGVLTAASEIYGIKAMQSLTSSIGASSQTLSDVLKKLNTQFAGTSNVIEKTVQDFGTWQQTVTKLQKGVMESLGGSSKSSATATMESASNFVFKHKTAKPYVDPFDDPALRKPPAGSSGSGGTVPPVATGAGAAGAGGGGFGGLGSLAGKITPASLGIGVAVAVIAAAIKNIFDATKRGYAGQFRAASGALSGNGSDILKGGIQYSGAIAQMGLGPLLGPVVAKVTDSFSRLVDVADKLAEKWGQFNATIAASNAQLHLQEMKANMRNAAAFAPIITEFNKLKGALVQFGSKVTEMIGAVASLVIPKILSGMTKMVQVVEWITQKLGMISDKDPNSTSKGSLLAGYAYKGFAFPQFNPASNRSAIGGGLGNVHGDMSGESLAKTLKEKRYAEERIELDKKELKSPGLSAEQRSYLQYDLDAQQKKLDAAKQRLNTTPGVGIPANPNDGSSPKPARVSDDGMRINNSKQPISSGTGVDFKQTVNVTLEAKVTHERAVHEAMFQVRDKLMQEMTSAASEAKLQVAMLTPASIGF